MDKGAKMTAIKADIVKGWLTGTITRRTTETSLRKKKDHRLWTRLHTSAGECNEAVTWKGSSLEGNITPLCRAGSQDASDTAEATDTSDTWSRGLSHYNFNLVLLT